MRKNDLTEYTLENVTQYLNWISTLSETITKAGRSFNGKLEKDIGFKNVVLLDLLQRVNFSLRGLETLFEDYITNSDMRHSINLVMRAILSDTLTALYLVHFYFDDKSFENEITVMNMDFTQFSKFIIENEPVFYNQNGPEIDVEIERKLSDYISKNPKLFKSSNKWSLKKTEAIRESSKQNLFINAQHISSKLTEKMKYETIKANPQLKQFAPIYVLFRYFSQYQHYSYGGRVTVMLSNEFDLHKYFISIYILNECVHLFMRLVGISDEMLEPLKQIAKDYDNIIEKK